MSSGDLFVLTAQIAAIFERLGVPYMVGGSLATAETDFWCSIQYRTVFKFVECEGAFEQVVAKSFREMMLNSEHLSFC